MNEIAYVVTAKAGPKVAGRRVSPGEEMLLTEFEARAELLAGSLTPKPVDAPIAADTVTEATGERPKKR